MYIRKSRIRSSPIRMMEILPLIGPNRRAKGFGLIILGPLGVLFGCALKSCTLLPFSPFLGLVCLLVPIILWLSRDFLLSSGFQVLLMGVFWWLSLAIDRHISVLSDWLHMGACFSPGASCPRFGLVRAIRCGFASLVLIVFC